MVTYVVLSHAPHCRHYVAKHHSKRSDAFYPGLMDKLLQERNTLNDLSMLDPLTGLYNRRACRTAWIPFWR